MRGLNCEAFEKTLHKQNVMAKIAIWASLLEEFDYEVEHHPRQRLKQVDALSCYPIMTVDDKVLLMIQEQQDRNLIVLPSKMHHAIIRKAHENGYFGVDRMSESINQEFYTLKLKDKLEKFVSCCVP